MKIVAIPKFTVSFPLPIEHVWALSKIASLHYDSTCKHAGSPNGFITGWLRHLVTTDQWNKEAGDSCMPMPLDINATSTELDTCMKIMEQASFHHACRKIDDAEIKRINETRALFNDVFHKLNDLYTKARTEWVEPFPSL